MHNKFPTTGKPLLTDDDETENAIDLFAGDEDIERASRSLKAMSHPLRLKILCTLGDQEISVQEIVDHIGRKGITHAVMNA